MPPRTTTITLTTDYGTRDHFVGSMKGVIHTINPQASIIDISHEVAAQDIIEAAFLLRSCYSFFPPQSIHVVVVDPSVGSKRKAILVGSEKYYYIAPDNGVLSLIYEVDPPTAVVEISAEHYILPEISKTFHGRDIFAPAAAWLSKGIDVSNFGDPVEQYVKLALPKSRIVTEGQVKGIVLHVDRFGNLITNFSQEEYLAAREKSPGDKFLVTIANREIQGLKEFYAESQKGELLALFGSTNYLEIAQNQGSAARTLGLSRGAEVTVQLK
jgi:S-adenosyl-L-methionine hydrolase (adenosine-forming)